MLYKAQFNLRCWLIGKLAGRMQVIINLSTGGNTLYVKEGPFFCQDCSNITIFPETKEFGDRINAALKQEVPSVDR